MLTPLVLSIGTRITHTLYHFKSTLNQVITQK